jgi:hypothetical protein
VKKLLAYYDELSGCSTLIRWGSINQLLGRTLSAINLLVTSYSGVHVQ